jgi:aminoglycoside 2'-N-acetyltransferase I
MHDVRVAHTADLDSHELAEVRSLLLDTFGPQEFTEEDREHSLGGLHVMARGDGGLAGHAAVVQRRLLHGGRALRTGYVEGVAVRPQRQGAGIGAALMREVERVIRGAYELGALGSTDEALGFYERLGWRPWRGPLRALTPEGIVDTPDERGGVFVLEAAVPLDLDGELICDWRDGDVW